MGGSSSGGFGGGLPFMDAIPGMGEPQPTTTDVTFDVSLVVSTLRGCLAIWLLFPLGTPLLYRRDLRKLPKLSVPGFVSPCCM